MSLTAFPCSLPPACEPEGPSLGCFRALADFRGNKPPRKEEWQCDTALSQSERALRMTRAWTLAPHAQPQLRLHLPRFGDPPLHAEGPDASVYAPLLLAFCRTAAQQSCQPSLDVICPRNLVFQYILSSTPVCLHTPTNDQKGVCLFKV